MVTLSDHRFGSLDGGGVGVDEGEGGGVAGAGSELPQRRTLKSQVREGGEIEAGSKREEREGEEERDKRGIVGGREEEGASDWRHGQSV